jgi:hypothetical protein
MIVSILLASAFAAPIQHSGRLITASGAPVEGEHTLVFTLHDAASGGNVEWTSAPMVVDVDGGYYSVALSSPVFPDDLFEEDLWITVSVDGTPLTGRQPLGAVPYARNSAAAGTLPASTAPPAACDATTAGSLYYDVDDKQVFACNSAVWTPIGEDGDTPGQAPADAQPSCQAIKAAQDTAPSGRYFIDPLGTGPYEVWCEMQAGGGGWELAMNLDTSDGNVRYYRDDAWWTAATTFGSVGAPFGSDFKSSPVFTTAHREVMIVAHQSGTKLGWRTWNLSGPASLSTYFNLTRSRSPAVMTGASTSSSVGSLDSREAVVRPGNALYVNQEWGSTVSYDLARLRNAEHPTTDNVNWGLGLQMDAQNNGQLPYYPGCDAGGTGAWDTYFCLGTDRLCNSGAGACGNTSGGTIGLTYDYAIYVRDPVLATTPNPSLLGNSSATAATSCDALHTARPTASSGRYWVNPSASSAFEVYCDMVTAGGGWTLMMNLDTSDGNARYYRDDTWWRTSTGYGNLETALTNDYKSSGVFGGSWSAMMIRVHREDLQTAGWRSWSLPANTNFITKFATAPARSGNVLTTGTTGADVGSLSTSDVVVRPAGQLQVNFVWGSSVSYDLARLRSDSLGTADNVNWGLGLQMDAQNNGELPHYPGCDAGSNVPWDSYFCIGTDRVCNSGASACGAGSGGSLDLMYDYAILVK